MPTISPTRTGSAGNYVATWTGLATGDTVVRYDLDALNAVFGCVTITGTFGGATVTMQGSNDGTNWFTIKDTSGTAVSATSAALFDFSTAAVYIRPGISGGTGDSITVKVSLRG